MKKPPRAKPDPLLRDFLKLRKRIERSFGKRCPDAAPGCISCDVYWGLDLIENHLT